MRKILVSLLLPLLMLLTQQAQAWHEIGHFHGSSNGKTERKQQQDQLGDKLCSLCFSFAHLSAATAPEWPKLQLATLTHAAPLAESVASHETDAPAQGNRDPPLPR